MGNVSGFGIGTYQPVSGGTVYGQGFQTQAFQLVPPLSGTYGGTYGYVLDTRIRAPASVVYTPPDEIGLDGTGLSVVRGYPALTWEYNTLRPDYWYYLMNIYNQSARTLPGFQYLVLLQYPDPLGSGTLVQNLARWDPPTQSGRTVGAYMGTQLHFAYIGQAVLNPNTPIVTLS